MWLKPLNAEQQSGNVRLICCGHAGSSYVDFTQWHKHLGSQVDVIAVSLPGRCERIKEAPITDINVLVEHIVKAIDDLPKLPTVIFGHSFGAVLAYEIAALCAKKNSVNSPKKLILSASALEKVKLLNTIDIADMSAVLDTFMRRGYLSPAQAENKKLMELILPYLLADIRCKEDWQIDSEFKLDIPIHTMAWEDDSLVVPDEVHMWMTRSKKHRQCQQINMPGGHLEYLNSPSQFFNTLNAVISSTAA